MTFAAPPRAVTRTINLYRPHDPAGTQRAGQAAAGVRGQGYRALDISGSLRTTKASAKQAGTMISAARAAFGSGANATSRSA